MTSTVYDFDLEFPEHCDSQRPKENNAKPELPQTDIEAAKLEALHVHEVSLPLTFPFIKTCRMQYYIFAQVYEKIANHFSGTRHSPWPRVDEFLRRQPPGSLVLDVGCGNGKYLASNTQCFAVRC